MAGKVAVTVSPFHGWFRESPTIPAGFKLNRTIATIALLNDFMADAPIIGTSLGRHERASLPIAYSCTNHWNHPLFCSLFIVKRPGFIVTQPDLTHVSSRKYNRTLSIVNENLFPGCEKVKGSASTPGSLNGSNKK
jgi:hypothetical protein